MVVLTLPFTKKLENIGCIAQICKIDLHNNHIEKTNKCTFVSFMLERYSDIE